MACEYAGSTQISMMEVRKRRIARKIEVISKKGQQNQAAIRDACKVRVSGTLLFILTPPGGDTVSKVRPSASLNHNIVLGEEPRQTLQRKPGLLNLVSGRINSVFNGIAEVDFLQISLLKSCIGQVTPRQR